MNFLCNFIPVCKPKYKTLVLNRIPINGKVKTVRIPIDKNFEDILLNDIHSIDIMDFILYSR